MRKRNTPAIEAEEVVAEAEEIVVEPVTESKKTEVTVVWRLGTRSFSKAVHGADFADLAKQFAVKHEGKIV